MKKIIVAITVFVFTVTGNIFAQTGGVHVASGDVNFSAGKMKEGLNTVLIKDGRGTLQFIKRADAFSDIIYKDAAGNTTSLTPAAGGATGAPRPACNSKLPDACFGSANKNIGLCICKSDAYHITLDLPGNATGKAQNRRVEVKLSY